ncbi:phage holin family protein [Flavobacterium sp. NG2]|uniref:phage holin family protein n=1 Tax=Flavobacterium sp. NG2 TaxID=3097547 RepID=UPI002A8346BA|nr:phage holin family protein [Flavobacterium sp. NG2]WPR72750.1 phage holin family protein [Flavobacterium sp. NG2]
MKLLIRMFITAILVVILSHVMKGVHVAGFTTALIVAFVLSLLNVFVKPVILIFTLPITVLTLGLFLLCINAIMILLCSAIVGGFYVDGFLIALLFSIILSVSQSLMFAILGKN